MNHNEDVAFNSLKLASKEESFSKNSGTLIVNGGIGCKKSINCENLITECFLNNKSAIFKNDVSIYKNLKVNIITPIEDDEPSSIGTSDNRFNDIYSNNFDTNNIYVNNLVSTNTLKTNYQFVNNSAEIGKNDKGNIMMNINDENNTITTNSDIFKVRNNNEISLEIDDYSIYLNALMKYKFTKIDIHDKTYNLYPEASLIIINSCIQNPQINLMITKNILSSDIIEDGTFVRIYNKSVRSCFILEKHILPINSFVEFIMIDSEWLMLRNDSAENDSFRAHRSAYFNGDIECSSDSHDDCDTSSNFGKDDESIGYEPNINNHRIIRRLKNTKCAAKISNVKQCDVKKENIFIPKKDSSENDCNENSTSFEVFN